jgi:hypothetical protein
MYPVMSCVIQIGPQPIKVRTNLVGLRTPEKVHMQAQGPRHCKASFSFLLFLRFASESDTVPSAMYYVGGSEQRRP